MLVTLEAMKTYLGIPSGTTDDDDFLTEQINLISAVIENYCGRKFLLNDYIQTFYDFDYFPRKHIDLYHYPVVSVAHIKENDMDTMDSYVLNKSAGYLTKTTGRFFCVKETVITYSAGYAQADIPLEIQAVVKELVS